MLDKYEVASEFCRGLAACLASDFRDSGQSQHWLAGWDAGYPLRRTVRHDLLNEYLASVGCEKMGIVHLADF